MFKSRAVLAEVLDLATASIVHFSTRSWKMNNFEDFEIVNEDEETNFPHQKDQSEENKTNFLKEVVILGGKLLCTDIYDLMGKASSEELHHVEIHTVTDRSMDSSAEDNRGLPGRKLTKSRACS